jgi:hypothetical protein
VRGQLCLQRTAVGTEAKEMGLEHHPGTGKGTGGGHSLQARIYRKPVLFELANYGVIKNVCSSSEVVLQTIENTMIYPGLGPSLEVIALHPVV